MTFVAILFGMLPSFAWLIFFLKEDIHPEPKKMLAKVFLAGVAIAFVALFFEMLFQGLSGNLGIANNSFVSLIGLSLIEEFFKFLAAYLLIRRSKFFDEPIDAIIYLITAALGFAVIENISVVLGIISQSAGPVATGIWGEIVAVIIIRFVGATLLHALSSGVLGYYWAKGIIHNKMKALIVEGIVAASVLHAIFNYIIMKSEALMIYPIIFLIIVAIFVFYDFEKIKLAEGRSFSIMNNK